MYNIIIKIKGDDYMNIDNFEILTKRLKQIRTEKGMTQKDFAQEMGITPVTLSAYENNLKKPSLDLILKVAKKYEISLDWLCGLSNKQNEKDNQEYKTYSDVLKTLMMISTIIPIEINTLEQEDGIFDKYERAEIFFNNKQFESFLANWNRFRKLLNDKSIDDDIYTACIEKLLRDSNIPINNIYDYNNDLPF